MKNLRKSFIKDFMVTLKIKHDETMPHIDHVFPYKGVPESVFFSFEVGYAYQPIQQNSPIEDVFEYTYICKYLKSLENKIHTCVIEYLLEEITNHIMEDQRVYYVKGELFRHKNANGSSVGVGIEKHK